jgi:hypothetical protein
MVISEMWKNLSDKMLSEIVKSKTRKNKTCPIFAIENSC